MKLGHTKFLRGVVPTKLEKSADGRITAHLITEDKEEICDEFDTVVFAIGRYAVTEGLNLAAAGLQTFKDGKFKVNDHE